MVIETRSPIRFVVFIVAVALLLAYVVWKRIDMDPMSAGGQGLTGLITEGLRDGWSGGEDPPGFPADSQLEGAGVGDAGGGSSLTVGTGSGWTADVFAEGRLERDQSRSHQLEVLQTVAHSEAVSEDTRAEAEAELMALNLRMTREADIENLIKARGFDDAVVFLYPEAAVVMVQAEVLTRAEVAQVADVIVKVAEIPIEGISVIARSR